MTSQPTEPYRMHPRTQDEIGAALPPSHRMAFYRDVGSAHEGEIAGVLRCRQLRLAIYNDPATTRPQRRQARDGSRAGLVCSPEGAGAAVSDWDDPSRGRVNRRAVHADREDLGRLHFEGPALLFPAEVWSAFVAVVKVGDFRAV
ncbi:hypothetical protein [Kitasatospora herbaricolor]|uniref:DUF397 domain-containing protein n=1 Tax=Kitasatospora herbaricolor TaxID=68217 RepID=A0ABZ1W7L2_9ACTN|nr:hypothetical protein [Kitasatospora herbaricolor]